MSGFIQPVTGTVTVDDSDPIDVEITNPVQIDDSTPIDVAITGQPINVNASIGATKEVAPTTQQPTGDLDAFGNLGVTEAVPVIQIDYTNGPGTNVVLTSEEGNGEVVPFTDIPNARNGYAEIKVNSGGTGFANVESVKKVPYRARTGVRNAFTAKFDNPDANSRMFAGMKSLTSAVGFGYIGTDFGVIVDTGGDKTYVYFEVDGANLNPGNTLSVVLQGVDYNVTNTGTNDISQDMRDVVDDPAFAYGQPWQAEWYVDPLNPAKRVLNLVSRDNGDFSAGFFGYGGDDGASSVQVGIRPGAAGTRTVTTQNNWSLDSLDGTNSAFNFDPADGNVFQIQLQWLGRGIITWSVLDPARGRFIGVHQINGVNSGLAPIITNPTFGYGISVDALSTAPAVTSTLYNWSCSIALEGPSIENNVLTSDISERLAVTSTEVPILGLYFLRVGNIDSAIPFPNIPLPNTNVAIGRSLNLSSQTNNNRNGFFRVYINAKADDAEWVEPVDGSEYLVVDKVSTSFTPANNPGRRLLFATPISASNTLSFSLDRFALMMSPGTYVLVTVASSGQTMDFACAVTWSED